MDLLSIWTFFENSAYMTGVVLTALGGVALLLLLLLYPISRDI